MYIYDFAPAIQLAATMNAAFVVVEYANSFTKVVAEKICRHPDLIISFKTTYENKVADLQIDNLKVHEIDGMSTVMQIEQIKKDCENLQKKIGKFEKELTSEMNEICNSHSFSFLSLYMFLYCILALFLVKDIQIVLLYQNMWSVFSIISFLILLCCVCFGEKKRIRNIVKNLEYTIYLLLVSIFISVVTAYVFDYYSIFQEMNQSVLSFITPIMPFIGFVVYAIMIKTKSKSLRKSINTKSQELDSDLKKLSDDIKPHLNMNKLTFDMNDQKSDSGLKNGSTSVSYIRRKSTR